MGLAADLTARLETLPAKVAALCASAFRRLRLAGVAIAGLAVALAVQTIRLDGLHIAPTLGPFHMTLVDWAGWRPRALAAEASLAAVKEAQPKAAAAQAEANRQPVIITARIAKEADAQTSDYLRCVASAATAHAGPVGGLCGAKAVEGVAVRSDLPGTDRSAQGDDGKAGSPNMVSVARADWDKLNREAAFRVQLYQVGQEWIAEGVAVSRAPDGL